PVVCGCLIYCSVHVSLVVCFPPHLSFLERFPQSFPLFPYTTLFRSGAAPSCSVLLHPPRELGVGLAHVRLTVEDPERLLVHDGADRKSTRLNSSHVSISYAVFC